MESRPNDIDLAGRSQTLPCVHLGGPWDGLTHQRDIFADQTTASIYQNSYSPDALPVLRHDYAVLLRDGHAILRYRGVTAVERIGEVA